jgi:hypothetical protein
MDELYECPICDLRFPSHEELRYHGQHEHGETFFATIQQSVQEEEGPIGMEAMRGRVS